MSTKLVNRLCEGEEAKTLLGEADDRIASLEKQNAELLAALGAKQAVIDRLMLEYCPNEMTQEQMAEWVRHQKRAD